MRPPSRRPTASCPACAQASTTVRAATSCIGILTSCMHCSRARIRSQVRQALKSLSPLSKTPLYTRRRIVGDHIRDQALTAHATV